MSAETKWTPGPWILEMNSVHTGSIATVHHCTDGWAEIWSENWIESGLGPEVMDANARLIAAAPELYAALLELRADMCIAQDNMRDAAKHDPRWCGCAEAIQPRVDAADAALAKARGEA